MARKIKVSRYSSMEGPSPDSAKRAIFIVLGVILLISGFAFGRITDSGGSDTSAINNQKTSSIGDVFSRYGGAEKKGIVPIGFDHSDKGAVTAAIAYVSLIPKLYFANNAIFNTSAVQITTPEFTQGFIDAIATNRSTAQDIYRNDPDAFFREFPLSYFVQSSTDDEVVVVVWSLFMLAARPDFDGKTESKIHVIQLKWDSNDWKVSNWKTRSGPSPRWQAPESTLLDVDGFLKAIEPFKGGFDYAPSF